MKQILVIEDDPSICQVLEEFFTTEGYEVTCLGDALEASRVLNGREFDLITLDLGLPMVDGNEFLHHLFHIGPDIPVVVISATPSKLVPNPLVKAVVPKPFDLDYLSNTIKHIV